MKDLLIEKLYEASKKPYQKYFKKNDPWNIGMEELLQFPEESLGFHLGCFLLKYNFEIQQKLEDHDVIHILTNTGITVQEEIGMQDYLYGKGKRSLYLFMVLFTGTLFYPTKIRYFLRQFQRGNQALRFHYLDFSKMLLVPIETVKRAFQIQ